MATAKFELLNDAMYVDGKQYSRGDTVELDKERGEELVEQGALRPATEKTTRGRSEPGKSEG